MIGALGGFVLPIAFGSMNDLLNVWTSCFMLLFALVATACLDAHCNSGHGASQNSRTPRTEISSRAGGGDVRIERTRLVGEQFDLRDYNHASTLLNNSSGLALVTLTGRISSSAAG